MSRLKFAIARGARVQVYSEKGYSDTSAIFLYLEEFGF